MKTKWCVLLLLLVAVPAFAQKKDEPALGPKGYLDVPAAELTSTYNALKASMPAPLPVITQAQVIDYLCMTSPGNPPVGKIRLYCDSGTGQLTCLSSSGSNVCPSGGGGTPAAPSGSIQYDNAGSFGATTMLFKPIAGG